MGFAEQVKASDASRGRKAVPGWLTDDTKIELRDNFFAEDAKQFRVSDKFRGTSFGVDQPFSTSTHMTVLFLNLTVELNKRPQT